MKRWSLVLSVLFAAQAFLSGLPAADVSSNYAVGPEDVLEIKVLRPEKIESTVTVGPDGSVSFPHIGSVHVKGRTLNEVQNEIQKRLSDGYMKYPDVAVALKESHSRKFFISGDVVTPGTYPVDDTTTVLKAISLAGGFSKAGSYGKGKVIRPRGGSQQIIPFNLKGVMNEKAADANIRLQPNDTVVVSEDKFFVYGDVAKPGTYPIEDNTTVLKAISLVGGFTKYGPASRVKVLRPIKGGPDYQTIRVNVKAVMDGAKDDTNVILQPDDTVVVSEDKFFVYGAVVKPGTYAIEENTTVLRAISMVGGFTKYGSANRVKILRPKKNEPGYDSIKIDMNGIIKGKASEGDVLIQPGDTIVVSEGIF